MKKISKKTSKKSTTNKAAKRSRTPTPKTDPKKMNEHLEKKCAVIKGLLVTSDLDTLKARCEIGLHVVQVMDDREKYGKTALGKLAVALGRDEDSLYDYAAVARLVPKEPFTKLLRERSIHGLPLTFSHWVVIADVCEQTRKNSNEKDLKKADAEAVKKGADLARTALDEGWSVRALKDKANPKKEDVGQDAAARVSDSLVASKKRLDRDLKVVVSELKGGNVSEERRTVARQLIDRLGEVRDAATQGIADLKGALEPASPGGEEESPTSDAGTPASVPPAATPPSRPTLEAMHRMVAR